MSYFGSIKSLFATFYNLLHLQMVPGHVQALQDMFCAPTVHPTAPTSPTIGANIFKHLSLGI